MGSYHHFYPGTNYNFSPEIDSIYGELKLQILKQPIN